MYQSLNKTVRSGNSIVELIPKTQKNVVASFLLVDESTNKTLNISASLLKNG